MPSGYTWPQLIQSALGQGVNLSSTAFFDPTQNDNGYEFSYFVYGAACSIVELDILTGELEILRTDIVYDGGISLNPAMDIGQVEGAFVQGIGFFFTEEIVTNLSGRIVNNGTWDYKPPGALDIPIAFNVTFLSNTPNQANMAVLSSKASGEPPYMLAASAFFAAKNAISAARAELQENNNSDFSLDCPATVEKIQLASLVDYTQLNLTP
jgi:xanthine dehydrogenase molybdopterin-binding subunit B